MRLFIVALVLIITAGCSTTGANQRDPLQPMNRAIYQFNDKADRWVMKPVAQGYRDYTPSLVRTGVSNFFSNLNDANSAVNYTLQGEPAAAFDVFTRFMFNSTIGLLGLFDITTSSERHYERTGFGDTFASWGWKDSIYLVIPFSGPSTLRDGTGQMGDLVFRENTLYSNPHDDAKLISNVINGVETRERLLGIEETIDEAALDPYIYVRDAWLQMRAKKTGDTPINNGEEELDIDELME